MCWSDKGHGQGYTFEELGQSTKNEKFWFAIQEDDLIRIYKGLNNAK
jgi:hypothetical protein